MPGRRQFMAALSGLFASFGTTWNQLALWTDEFLEDEDEDSYDSISVSEMTNTSTSMVSVSESFTSDDC